MYNLDLVTIVIIAANVIISFKGFDDRCFLKNISLMLVILDEVSK